MDVDEPQETILEQDEAEEDDIVDDNESNDSSVLNSHVKMEDEMAEIQSHLHGDQSLDGDEQRQEDENLKSLIQDDMINDEQDNDQRNNDENELNTENDESDIDNEYVDEEDSDEDDNVQITIGEIDFKSSLASTGPGYLNLNLQKGGRQFAQNSAAKNVSKSALDMDAVGTYNGMQIYDVNLDTIEDKPWRKPGSDITDYFNYGFTEETWKIYCERQRKIRSINQNGQFDTNAVINSVTASTLPVPNNNFMSNNNSNKNQMINNNSNDQKDQKSSQANDINQSNIPAQSSTNENSKYHNQGNPIVTINTQQQQGMINMKKPPPMTSVLGASNSNARNLPIPIDVIGSQSVPPPSMPLVPPPPLPSGHSGLLGSRPSNNSSSVAQNHSNSDRAGEVSSISVIGNRSGGPPPPSIPFPPMQMPPPPPPFAFGPPPGHHDSHFPPPPPIRPPPIGILPPPPPIGPNGQPMPFAPADFAAGIRATYMSGPPGSGMLSHPSDQRASSFEDFDERHSRRPMSSNDYDDFERNSRDSRYRNTPTDRDYEEQRSSRHSSSSYRDRDRDYERERDRERKERRSRERSRDRSDNRSLSQHESSSSSSSNRNRSNRDRSDRSDRSDRDRESRKGKDKERDHHHRDSHRSDKESKSSSSSSKPSESSSDHKHRSSHSSSSKSSSSKSSSKRESSSSSRNKESSSRNSDK